MISRRNSGVFAIKSWAIFLWIVGWFALHLVVGAELIGKITYEQTNYGVYFLGIILAQLVRLGYQEKVVSLKPPSSRWLTALGTANKDTLVILTVLFAIVFVTKDKGISRVFLSTFLVSLWPTLVLLHRYLPVLLTAFLFGKTQRFTTVLIGSPKKARSLSNFVNELPRSGLEVAGLVTIADEASEVTDSKIPVLGCMEDLEKIIDAHAVDQIVILESEQSRHWFNEIFTLCDNFGCHVMVYNFWDEYFDQPVHFTRQGAHTFFMLHDEPLQNPINRVLKRLLDIVVSLPIVFGLLPVLCAWVMIKQAKEAPGPLFFRQYRSGFQKNRFKIFKFRSMYNEDDSSDEAKQATKADNRIFPFGAFMRRRSIDEFPQFINVLKGDMSIVGPRPHLLQHDDAFADTVNTYRIRHFVKPGLTGLAQVNGFRGEVTDDESIKQRVKMDIAYINSWSIVMDVEIILKTVSELFSPPDSAY